MSKENGTDISWKTSLSYWLHPRAITMLFLGFSAGLPIWLIFGTLSLWLREAGVSKSAVTFFSWAALGYSFKFIWAPLIDLLPLPVLSRLLGRRRSWLLVAQFAIISALCWMAMVDPSTPGQSLTYMGLAAVMLGFSSATQDVVIDAFRIESAAKHLQAMLASMYIAGYRIGMLVAGAGALYLASALGSNEGSYSYSAWMYTYLAMALAMLIGVGTTLVISEPELPEGQQRHDYTPLQYLRMLILFFAVATTFALVFFYSGGIVAELKSAITERYPLSGKIIGFFMEVLRFTCSVGVAGVVAWLLVKSKAVDRQMVHQSYVLPIQDFFLRYGVKAALLVLMVVGFYRISDIVLGVISLVFYADMGFTKPQIAAVSKTFGLGMTILGGFLGGILTIRYGVFAILFIGAVLSAATNLLFMVLAGAGPDVQLLTLVIVADNLSAGIATTAFIAFLSALTNISFTATQYAIFSSLMTLFPKLIGGYSGTIVSGIGYAQFFLLTAAMGIPVLLLVYLAKDIMDEG